VAVLCYVNALFFHVDYLLKLGRQMLSFLFYLKRAISYTIRDSWHVW